MLIKDLPNPRTRTGKIYSKFKRKGILYPEAKKYLVDTYAVASSGDLTLEQYEEVRAYIRSLPSIRQKNNKNNKRRSLKIKEVPTTMLLRRKRRYINNG